MGKVLLERNPRPNYKPWLKLLVAFLRSERLKVIKEDLKLYNLLRTGCSLVLLLFHLGIFGTPIGGMDDVKRLNDLFFHDLKKFLQWDFAFELELLDSDSCSSGESNSFMHASKTPLGVPSSSFSLSRSQCLKSRFTKMKKKKL